MRKPILYIDLFVDVSEYLLELLREVVVVPEDLLREFLLVIIVKVAKEVLKRRLEPLEGLSFEARGYESNLTVLPSEFLRVVLEVSLYLD